MDGSLPLGERMCLVELTPRLKLYCEVVLSLLLLCAVSAWAQVCGTPP